MKRTIIPIFALAIIAAGCEDIYEGEAPNYLQDVKVSFNPEIEPYGEPDSEDMAAGADAGVFMIKYGTDFSAENIINGMNNTRFVTDAEGLLNVPQGSEAILFPAEANKYDFILYSPYRETLDAGNTISLDLDAADTENLLYSDNAKGKYKSASAVKAEFRHVPAKMSMNITNGQGITEDDLKSLDVTFSGMYSTGVLDLLKGSVSYTGEAGKLDAEVASDGKSAEVLILPTDPETSAGARELIFSTGGVAHSYIFDAAQVFEMGKEYVLDVTVSVPGISIEISEIKDWTVETVDGVSSL